jgi:hypothetical protein
VHEFRAELDGRGEARLVSRPDAAADAITRFENENAATARRERGSCRKPGCAGTDHENIMSRHDQYTLGNSGGLYAVA